MTAAKPLDQYLRSIRNPAKRKYAEEWVRYCTQKLQDHPLPNCGYLAAQAVRMTLADKYGIES